MDHRANVYQDKLDRAEAFVRDVLRIMGQHADADNPILVTRVALNVMAALQGQVDE
jgi:hypothetical protein